MTDSNDQIERRERQLSAAAVTIDELRRRCTELEEVSATVHLVRWESEGMRRASDVRVATQDEVIDSLRDEMVSLTMQLEAFRDAPMTNDDAHGVIHAQEELIFSLRSDLENSQKIVSEIKGSQVLSNDKEALLQMTTRVNDLENVIRSRDIAIDELRQSHNRTLGQCENEVGRLNADKDALSQMTTRVDDLETVIRSRDFAINELRQSHKTLVQCENEISQMTRRVNDLENVIRSRDIAIEELRQSHNRTLVQCENEVEKCATILKEHSQEHAAASEATALEASNMKSALLAEISRLQTQIKSDASGARVTLLERLLTDEVAKNEELAAAVFTTPRHDFSVKTVTTEKSQQTQKADTWSTAEHAKLLANVRDVHNSLTEVLLQLHSSQLALEFSKQELSLSQARFGDYAPRVALLMDRSRSAAVKALEGFLETEDARRHAIGTLEQLEFRAGCQTLQLFSLQCRCRQLQREYSHMKANQDSNTAVLGSELVSVKDENQALAWKLDFAQREIESSQTVSSHFMSEVKRYQSDVALNLDRVVMVYLEGPEETRTMILEGLKDVVKSPVTPKIGGDGCPQCTVLTRQVSVLNEQNGSLQTKARALQDLNDSHSQHDEIMQAGVERANAQIMYYDALVHTMKAELHANRVRYRCDVAPQPLQSPHLNWTS